jgi:peptidoglycan hydrolase CwlO-like protein
MPLNYTSVTDKIKKFLTESNTGNNTADKCKKIFLIGGMFGTGKSACVRDICAEIKDSSLADVIYFLNPEGAKVLADIPGSFYPFVVDNDLNGADQVIEESEFNRNKLFEILNFVNSRNQELTERAYEQSTLKSKWEQYLSLRQSTDALSLIEKLSGCVEKKSHMMYFNDPESIVSEAFIVDLMNTFYPSGKEDGYEIDRPIKIVFVLDDYDYIAGTIDNWLVSSFFSYCFTKPLDEYKYYTISQAKEGSKASDFFDFHFIISGREPLKDYEGKNSILDFADYIDDSVLRPFEVPEVKEYIEKKEVFVEESPEKIYEITGGVPVLLDFYLDQVINESSSPALALHRFAFNEIFKYRTETEKRWIIPASYLNIISPQGLKCFPGLKPVSEDLSCLLSLSGELTEKVDNKGASVIAFLKHIIKETLSEEEPERAEELARISAIANGIAELMSGLSSREFEAARNLAYFDRFDLNYSIEKAYQNDAALVNSLLLKKSGWFTSDKFTYRLNDSERNRFLDYNRLVDRERFEEKQVMINQLWNDYQSELTGTIKAREKEIPALSKKIADIEKSIISGKQRHNEIQPKFMEIENSLIETRKALSLFSPQTYFSYAGINFLVALVTLLIGIFLPALFDKGSNHTAIGTSKDILFIIMGIFAFIGLFHIGRYVSKLTKKEERSALDAVLKKGEDERNSYLNEMKEIKDKNDSAQKQIFEINEKIKKIKSELSELNDKIKQAKV